MVAAYNQQFLHLLWLLFQLMHERTGSEEEQTSCLTMTGALWNFGLVLVHQNIKTKCQHFSCFSCYISYCAETWHSKTCKASFYTSITQTNWFNYPRVNSYKIIWFSTINFLLFLSYKKCFFKKKAIIEHDKNENDIFGPWIIPTQSLNYCSVYSPSLVILKVGFWSFLFIPWPVGPPI